MPAHDDLTLLIEAAQAAGEIARRHWQQSPETWDKPGGHGPVTEADLEVDAMLSTELRAARPDYGWLSEESTDEGERLNAERCFIIDPIDGTRAFISGERSFGHALAVAEAGRVTAAVVYMPVLGKLYSAALGQGAEKNGTAINASAQRDENGATLLAARPNYAEHHWPGGVTPAARAFRSSLAYRLALVAEGRFDGMITFRDSWEWDIAAGALIAAEAGAEVSDRAGGGLSFNNPEPKLPGVVTAPPDLHQSLMARINPK